MTSVAHKARSAGYYLARPRFWSHFFHRGLGYLGRNNSVSSSEPAVAWARIHAKPVAEILGALRIADHPSAEVLSFPEKDRREGAERVKRTGISMGGGANVDLLYGIALATGARSIVETGVAFGWSSFAFLLALDRNGDGRLVSVDRPYPGAGTEQFVGAAVRQDLKRNWTIIREPDRNGLRRALALFPDGLDLAHYDSDKTPGGRRFGYHLLWEKLKAGGVFVSDDIQDNMMFAEFVAAKNAPFGVVETAGKYVGIAVKPYPGG